MAGNLARTLLLPALPQFLARYPDITLQIGESERDVDLVREESTASFAAAISRQRDDLPAARRVAGDHLRQSGLPRPVRHPHTIEGLTGHVMIGFVSSRTQRTLPLSFTQDGRQSEVSLPCRLLTSDADVGAEAARLALACIRRPCPALRPIWRRAR